MMKVFIGYDSKEPVAYHVLAHSILQRATIPVSITPIALKNLDWMYTRERSAKETTEFSISRFLVPYLSDYRGISVFMDCDMLCRVDIKELHALVSKEDDKAIYVCKHDYVPKTDKKFLGQEQTKYPRKNWSSMMVFNNAKCRALSPAFVNVATGLELHRFQWLQNDELIGELPLEWNWLVGEYEKNDDAKILHWTLGGPWFESYATADYAKEWYSEFQAMAAPEILERS